MNDFFGFILLILVLIPVVMIVMLAKLMARQTLYRDETGQTLRIIVDVLREDRELLKALSQRYADTPPAPTPQPAVFEAAEPAIDQVLFESPNPEVVPELETPNAESADAASAINEVIEADETFSEPVPQAAEPSRFELAARQILQEVWNWIIVGEGHRPEGVAIEYAVASNWLLRIGVLILVTGIGFFLKYSIDNGLLGEHARVALSLLAGAGMIIAGVRFVQPGPARRRYCRAVFQRVCRLQFLSFTGDVPRFCVDDPGHRLRRYVGDTPGFDVGGDFRDHRRLLHADTAVHRPSQFCRLVQLHAVARCRHSRRQRLQAMAFAEFFEFFLQLPAVFRRAGAI